MSVRGAIIAGLLYAALMTLWALYRNDPMRDSYALGFAFYAVSFAVLYWVGMNLLARFLARGKGNKPE